MLIDLHAHTAPRSNCSRTTLEELVETARARGLDALCITEHDVRWPGDELADASRLLDFPLIPGVELTTDVGHVLVFGPLRKPLWLGYKLDELVEECEQSDTALVLPIRCAGYAGERAIKGGRTPPLPADVAALPQWEAVHAIEVGEHADHDARAHADRGRARGGAPAGRRRQRRPRPGPGRDLRHRARPGRSTPPRSSPPRSAPATSAPSTSPDPRRPPAPARRPDADVRLRSRTSTPQRSQGDSTMGDAVIISAARTAIGTARKGTLLDVTAFDLAKESVGEALKRSGIPADDVDDLQMGESLQGGGDIARYAAVELGLTNVPGVALNRHCASGMAAVQGAAASIRAGMDTVVIAGGAESVSTLAVRR